MCYHFLTNYYIFDRLPDYVPKTNLLFSLFSQLAVGQMWRCAFYLLFIFSDAFVLEFTGEIWRRSECEFSSCRIVWVLRILGEARIRRSCNYDEFFYFILEALMKERYSESNNLTMSSKWQMTNCPFTGLESRLHGSYRFHDSSHQMY